MNKPEILTLLSYWHKRQGNPKVKVAFRFKGYKNKSTGDILPAINVSDRKPDLSKSRNVRNGKKVAKAGKGKSKAIQGGIDSEEGEEDCDRGTKEDIMEELDSGDEDDGNDGMSVDRAARKSGSTRKTKGRPEPSGQSSKTSKLSNSRTGRKNTQAGNESEAQTAGSGDSKSQIEPAPPGVESGQRESLAVITRRQKLQAAREKAERVALARTMPNGSGDPSPPSQLRRSTRGQGTVVNDLKIEPEDAKLETSNLK
jgi:hypothetical protein